MSEIDFVHDSLAEITLKQAEALQGYDRLMEALLVVEGWVFRRIQAEPGEKTCDAEPLHRILTECFAYSEDGVTPPWLEAGKRTLAEIEDEEER